MEQMSLTDIETADPKELTFNQLLVAVAGMRRVVFDSQQEWDEFNIDHPSIEEHPNNPLWADKMFLEADLKECKEHLEALEIEMSKKAAEFAMRNQVSAALEEGGDIVILEDYRAKKKHT